MCPPAPPARSSCPSPSRRRRRPGRGTLRPSATTPQTWLATRTISLAATSDKKYPRRHALGTTARTSRRNPGVRNAPVPAGAPPPPAHTPPPAPPPPSLASPPFSSLLSFFSCRRPPPRAPPP